LGKRPATLVAGRFLYFLVFDPLPGNANLLIGGLRNANREIGVPGLSH
jgi:hypothetical protein